ncbi:17161_t:CDS:2 [Funneliformis caledonium]|uniref:17161_t:CDS:1 n=2 Tax=Funneliformis TaxID=1117308 RepID=A0A9N8V2Q6_9GLOM|nr:17161_t:CDS:2 [Funneliformis caledonium]CAG8447407.1 13950_t:CDS:2 [Funneliformis mosseae]
MITDSKKQHVATPNQEKHHQRGTLTDIRALPKKSGAGNGNWGVVGDEINSEEYNLMMATNITKLSNVQSSHIKVIATEEFMKLRNAVSVGS